MNKAIFSGQHLNLQCIKSSKHHINID